VRPKPAAEDTKIDTEFNQLIKQKSQDKTTAAKAAQEQKAKAV